MADIFLSVGPIRIYRYKHISEDAAQRYSAPLARDWQRQVPPHLITFSSMGTFAETAILEYRLSFADQGKQTLVFRFCFSVCS
jgi:hypothetical protein